MVDLVILIIFDWREKSPSDNRERRLNIQDRSVCLENWGPYPNFGCQKGDVKEAPYWGSAFLDWPVNFIWSGAFCFVHVSWYSPVPVSCNPVGEEVGQKRRKRETQGMRRVSVFLARNVSEKYQSQIRRPLEHYEPTQSLWCYWCFCTYSSCSVIYSPGEYPPHPAHIPSVASKSVVSRRWTEHIFVCKE
jgi:hypothetical protein